MIPHSDDPLHYYWLPLSKLQLTKAQAIVNKAKLKFDKSYKLQQDILNELGISDNNEKQINK